MKLYQKYIFPYLKQYQSSILVNDSFWFINRHWSFYAYLYIRIPHFSYGSET